MGAVAEGVEGGGEEDEFGFGHAFDFAFGDAEFWGIDEVVGGVDPHDGDFDGFEFGRRVVIARRGDLIKDVVGVEIFGARGVLLVEIFVDGVARGHVLLHVKRGAAGDQEKVNPGLHGLLGLFGVVAAFVSGIAGDGFHGHAAPEAIAAGDLYGKAGEGHERVHEVGIGFAPDERVHAAHGRAGDEAEVVHLEAVGEEEMLRGDHVVVVVMREMGAEAVAGFGGFAVADAVGKDDEVFGGVEKLAGIEEFVGVEGREELMAGAAGTVEDEDGVVHMALRVAMRAAERGVVEAELGKFFAGAEGEIFGDEVAFGGGWMVGSGRLRVERRCEERCCEGEDEDGEWRGETIGGATGFQ